ncbi:MAG: DNA mismatch repair endonuclease MutL [candidate division Zixibacteria bacterium]|nr:DNA mismatch repair endonuclease MutL [candidate division Zixibacteria bacterium]
MSNATASTPKIKILDENLINKIAAGEVIERPASVVKEMVENSIDAGARNISIELEEGGLKLIAIHDDGIGIAGDDLELAFTRHATSKILKAEDLFNILSFGFRGEALPSIASVAHVRALSRFRDRNAGSEIEIEGGKFKSLKAAGCPPGTSIYVSNLFFNTPARRKFIKSPRAELARITELVTSYSIGNYSIGFKLKHNDRYLMEYPPAKTLKDRLGAIYGYNSLENFIPLPGTDEGAFDNPGTLLGYISHPDQAKSRATDIRFFVNFRPIYSRTLMAALKQGYGNKLHPKLYPVCAVFFNMLPRDIDVNVHPAKTEIRFKNESELFIKLKRVVEHGLRSAGVLTGLSIDENNESPSLSGQEASKPFSFKKPPEQKRDMQESLYKGGFTGPSAGPTPDQSNIDRETGEIKPDIAKEPRTEANLYDRHAQPKMWQFKESFIVVPLKDSLMFIDQHNAHERILYEAAIHRLKSGKTSTQQLLFPITVDLTPSEFARWTDYEQILAQLGYEISEFGGNSLIITGIPAGSDDSSPEIVLRKILDDFPGDEDIQEDLNRRAAASFACHSAIKAGQKLSPEEMNLICDKLFACEEFNVCPHGRPIIARLTVDEIEKKFQRIIPEKK